jgi:predicted phosphodiesterase
MKLAVFSDVHGNLPALESMLHHAGEVDGYICLGDVVNYGPWGNECIDTVCGLENLVYLRGNHEEYFTQGTYPGKNEIARAFFDICYPQFERIDKIRNLPITYILEGYVFRHTILDKNIYPDTELGLDNNYVIGHSHHQFKIAQPPFTLYNPGSVGQNRKYINVINYAILESDSMTFEMRQLNYDETIVIDEMKRRGYPAICISYYDSKERLKL